MIWIVCILTLLFSGCQQHPQETHYKEIDIPASAQNVPMAPFTWAVPQGWIQEAGGGMRLVTFHLVSDPEAIDCSIVSLEGMAGGLEANLRRWMGQIAIEATSDQLNSLISSAPSFKIKSGQEGKVFDFTTLESDPAPSQKSMIVVMVTMDTTTLFVKMTGTEDRVTKNKEDFFKLASSIEYHP